jgi:hypothetical protein
MSRSGWTIGLRGSKGEGRFTTQVKDETHDGWKATFTICQRRRSGCHGLGWTFTSSLLITGTQGDALPPGPIF